MTTNYKLVFAGPVGAGKTTAIQSLSEIDVVNTDVAISDETRAIKKNTTVAMDYGLMKLDDGTNVRLYGAPGQKRFDFMWDILTENALGLVLMLKGNAPDPIADLRMYVKEFRELIDNTAVVVGITHTDISGWKIRTRIMDEMRTLGLPPLAMTADARSQEHMATLVKILIHGIDPFDDGTQQQHA